MADKLEFEVSATGTAEAAAGLANVTKGLKDTTAAAAEGGPRLQQLGSNMMVLSSNVRELSPGMSDLTRVIGQTTTQIGSLSTTAGGLGIALAGATGAASLLSQALSDIHTQTMAARDAAANAIPTFDQLATSIRNASQERARMERMRAGGGTSIEYQASAEQGRQQLAQLEAALRGGTAAQQFRQQYGGYDEITENDRISALGSAGGQFALQERERRNQAALSGADRQRAQHLIETLRAQVENATQAGTRAAVRESPAFASEEEWARWAAGQGSADVQAQAAANAREKGLQSEAYGASNRRRGGGGRTRQDPNAMANAIINKQNESADLQARLNADNDNGQREMDAAIAQKQSDSAAIEERQRQQTLEQERQWYQERTRQRDDFYDGWAEKGAAVGAAFGDVLNMVASGQASLLQAAEQVFKQFLAQTAKSESIEAGKAFAKAIGAAFVNPPAAAGFVAEGIAHLAVAGAAGGAQMLVSGHGGGAPAARPTPIDRSGSHGDGGTVVINLNSPVVTAGTHEELSRTLQRATDTRHFGSEAA